MDIIKRLVREVLSTPPKKKKEKCNCGCHSCENVGNKGPVLNENLEARIIMTENMKYHVNNKLSLTENTFRYGSKSFLDLWAEARYLFSRDVIHVNDDDKEILLETNLGEYGYYENQKVPLDLPMLEEEDSRSFILPYESLLKQIKKDADSYKEEERKLMDLYYEIEQAIFDKNIPQMLSILRKYGLYGKYSTLLNINESDKKKTPALNKPKRGGSKKFYVYVRDPKTKRVKKVSFGAPGMSVGFKNPKRRKAFAARHKCAQKTDRTKPSYWSCRVGRYAKQLGLGNNFSGFW